MFVKIRISKKRGANEMLKKVFLVEDKHSAKQVGSGDLDVLSTPSMIAFMENVAKKLAESKLQAGETTVGIDLNVKHIKATAIGREVRIEANLTQHHKTILSYEIFVYENDQLIGKGTHKRGIVNANQFMENL